MSLIRPPSRTVAAFIMLVGMLMMQISIAACRCQEAPASVRSMAGIAHHDGRGAAAEDMRAGAAERKAHGAHDHQAHSSCDSCIEYLELAKKLSDSTDHPRVAPFTPSALHLVLDKTSAVMPTPPRPDSACDLLAGAPQLHIRQCSFQL